jgi:predicted RNase H-like nuclease
MLFVGLDLAWSERNSSGFAVIDGDRKRGEVISFGLVGSQDDIRETIKKLIRNENAFIAVDAPLIVPNETGRRKAEEITGRFFRQYNAGAHPANRSHLSSWTGRIRGEDIAAMLKKEGFAHSPYIGKYEEDRRFFEVYPHPSMVVLFDLKKVIPYKNKPNRDYQSRWAAFSDYQKHMRGLAKASPALAMPKELERRKMEGLKGQALKDYEDVLDAVFCAYIAYYAWANPGKCAVLGDMAGGYILTPIFDSMRLALHQDELQKKL